MATHIIDGTIEDVDYLAGAKDADELKERLLILQERSLAKYNDNIEDLRNLAADIIAKLEKEDYIKFMHRNNVSNEEIDRNIREAAETETDPEKKANTTKYLGNWYEYTECFADACTFIESQIHFIGIHLAKIDAKTDRHAHYLAKLISDKAEEWYKKPSSMEYFPIIRTRPTVAVGLVNSLNKISEDTIAGNTTYLVNDVQVTVKEISKVANNLGINVDKLLCMALASFLRKDHSANSTDKTVIFSFIEYARALGYNVDAADHKTAKNNIDNARKAINKDLKKLLGISLSWEEKRGKKLIQDTDNVSIFQRTRISNGQIILDFSDRMAEYLRHSRLIAQYPVKLLSIDPRDPNTYKIGKKLIDHYNQYNNMEKGTNDFISVKALLKASDITSYESVLKSGHRGWGQTIRDPFQKALAKLKKIGVLEDYRYCHEKREPVSDEDLNLYVDGIAQNGKRAHPDYSFFEGLYIQFEPAVKIDQTERLERKAQEIIEAKAKEVKPKKKKAANKEGAK